jgi:hypothetical protein
MLKRRTGEQMDKHKAAELVLSDLEQRWPASEFDTRAERDAHAVVISWSSTATDPSEGEVLTQAQDTLRGLHRPGHEGSGYGVRAAPFVSMEAYIAALLLAHAAGTIEVGRRLTDTVVGLPRDPAALSTQSLTPADRTTIETISALAEVTAEDYFQSMARGRGYVRTRLARTVHDYADAIAAAVT